MADRSGALRGTCLLLGALTLLPTPVLGQGEPVGPEFRVNTYTAGYQDEPAVGSDGSGNFVVVWTGEPAPPGYVIAQRFASAESLSAPSSWSAPIPGVRARSPPIPPATS